MAKVSIICSSKSHPIYPYLEKFIDENQVEHDFSLVNKTDQLIHKGDILFLVSCSEFIKNNIKELFSHTLVLHASDLPSGRGWSPHIWDILTGKDRMVLSLLDAGELVDTGRVWRKVQIPLIGDELYKEINELLFSAELDLIKWACNNFGDVSPESQIGEPSYYKKRCPEDSRINVEGTIAEQFNLLRVCDPDRFPAYFDYAENRYTIKIEKVGK